MARNKNEMPTIIQKKVSGRYRRFFAGAVTNTAELAWKLRNSSHRPPIVPAAFETHRLISAPTACA
jgi:hypothetical protein